MKTIKKNLIRSKAYSGICVNIIYLLLKLSLISTSALAQTNEDPPEEEPLLLDSIIIEKVKILRPEKYEPGDILIPKGYLFLLQDNRAAYLLMVEDRRRMAREIDSLWQANRLIYDKLDSAERLIYEQRGAADLLSQKILKMDLENIRAEAELKEDWSEFQKIEKTKRVRLLYQFHTLKKWDRVAVCVFGLGVGSFFVYLITETIIGALDKSANQSFITPIQIPGGSMSAPVPGFKIRF